VLVETLAEGPDDDEFETLLHVTAPDRSSGPSADRGSGWAAAIGSRFRCRRWGSRLGCSPGASPVLGPHARGAGWVAASNTSLKALGPLAAAARDTLPRFARSNRAPAAAATGPRPVNPPGTAQHASPLTSRFARYARSSLALTARGLAGARPASRTAPTTCDRPRDPRCRAYRAFRGRPERPRAAQAASGASRERSVIARRKRARSS
jgi:hypothetical protein